MASPRSRSTRSSSAPISIATASPTLTSSFAPPARCASPTSFSGRGPTPNTTPPPSTGPASARPKWTRPSSPSAIASVALAALPPHPTPPGTSWSPSFRGRLGVMLRQRVISSALGLPPIIALIWVGGAWFSVAVGLIVLAGTAELYETATRASGRAAGPGGVGMKRRPMWPLGLAFSPLLVAAAHFGGPWPAAALTALIVLGLVAALSRDPAAGPHPRRWTGG